MPWRHSCRSADLIAFLGSILGDRNEGQECPLQPSPTGMSIRKPWLVLSFVRFWRKRRTEIDSGYGASCVFLVLIPNYNFILLRGVNLRRTSRRFASMYIEEVCDERARPRRRQKRQRPATFRLPSHPARPCSNQRRSSRQSASRDYSWIRIIVITSTPSLPPAAAGGAVAASSSSRVPRRRRSCPRAHRRSSTRRRTPPRPRRDGHRRDALPLIAAGSPPDCICRD